MYQVINIAVGKDSEVLPCGHSEASIDMHPPLINEVTLCCNTCNSEWVICAVSICIERS